MSYATKTAVPVARTRLEIEALLAKHGADQFISGYEAARAMIGFRKDGRLVRLIVPLPSGRTKEAQAQLERSRWRTMLLVLKAKLEAVAAGVVEFEEEFMAHIVMPDGQTVSRHVRPRISEAYKTGKMPALLPAGGTP